jgi:hypothetical protein
MDKIYEPKEIRELVGSNQAWAERALQALYAKQTTDERNSHQTIEKNHVGFNGVDAEILTSFAEQLATGRRQHLSPKQLAIAYKKLPKYAKQLHQIAYGGA